MAPPARLDPVSPRARLDGPTGVARLPDGRWIVAEGGHARLTVITG
jgi:hypothetical protein